MYFAVVALLVFIALFLLRIQFPRNYLAMRKLHGPPMVPIFGNAHKLATSDVVKISETLLAWCKAYRSPFRIKLGNVYWVALTKASHVESLLRGNANISKSSEYDILEPWLGTGLLISSGSKWHRRRAQLTPAFHSEVLKNFVPIMNEHAMKFCQILQESADSGKQIDVTKPMLALSLDVICETAFGKLLNSQTQHSKYADAVVTLSELTLRRMVSPWLRPGWIFDMTPWGRTYNEALKVVHDFSSAVARERESENCRHVPKDCRESLKKVRPTFLDLLLDLKKSGQIDDDGVAEEVGTLMYGGHDTAAYGLAWALYCIGRHENVQRRLQDEIDQMFQSLRGDIVQSHDVSKLEYLDCVLKEVLRQYPPVPAVGRRTEQAFQVDGIHIPEGTMIIAFLLALHHDAEVFPDPLRFDPSRFARENVVGRHALSYVPFSAGPRSCIGQKFAMLELKISICHILHRFSLEAIDKPSDVKPTMQLTLKPANGIWLNVASKKGSMRHVD